MRFAMVWGKNVLFSYFSLDRVKANNNVNMKVDLYLNGDLIDANEKKLVSQLQLTNNTVRHDLIQWTLFYS